MGVGSGERGRYVSGAATEARGVEPALVMVSVDVLRLGVSTPRIVELSLTEDVVVEEEGIRWGEGGTTGVVGAAGVDLEGVEGVLTGVVGSRGTGGGGLMGLGGDLALLAAALRSATVDVLDTFDRTEAEDVGLGVTGAFALSPVTDLRDTPFDLVDTAETAELLDAVEIRRGLRPTTVMGTVSPPGVLFALVFEAFDTAEVVRPRGFDCAVT